MEQNTRRKSKIKALSFRNEIAEKIDLHAEKQNRSASNFVETVLMKYFEEIEEIPQEELAI